MSLNFSANQYEKAFYPTRIQNWEVPKGFGQRPHARDGFTQIIASNRGHLLPGVARSRTSPWGTFVGTWDMPTKIPGNSMMNGTARTEHAIDNLLRCKTDGEIILSGNLKKCKIPEPLPVVADVEAGGDTVVKPPTPMLATNNGTGLAVDQKLRSGSGSGSGVRSGAKNPVPKSPQNNNNTSPHSLEWPQPGQSRAQIVPPQIASPKSFTPDGRPHCKSNSPALLQNRGTPEPELQALSPVKTPVEPVQWHMPKSTEPLKD